MYGVVDGVYFCNEERLNEINERINERNIPSESLRPEFSLRPVSTKYALLPIVDRVEVSDVPLKEYSPFSVETIFNPGTAQAPWRGFAENINVDSALRNQFFALQKSPEAEYIPSSKSSLYEFPLASNNFPRNQYESGNFKTEDELTYSNKSTDLFNNCTRCQRMSKKLILFLINMNDINDIDQLTLEYLINPLHYNKYYKKDEELDKELLNDKIFYKKRIINCIKEMLRGEFVNKSLEENFNIYIRTIIIYLKEVDRKDILQKDYIDLSNNNIFFDNSCNNLKNNIELSNSLLYNEQNKTNIMNKFIKHKNNKTEQYSLPIKKDINLKDPKLKKKGIPKKEKYNDNINENKKKSI